MQNNEILQPENYIPKDISPVYVPDRDYLLKEQTNFQSRIDTTADLSQQFNEIVQLTGRQDNQAVRHLDEYISDLSQDRSGESRQLHDTLTDLFRNLKMENEQLVQENGSLSNQVNTLIGYVNQYKDWKSSVVRQLDQNRKSIDLQDILNFQIRALKNKEYGYIGQINNLKFQLAEFENIRKEYDQLKIQNQNMIVQTQNHQLKMNEFENLRLEITDLSNQRDLHLKSQADGFNQKYQTLEKVNRSLSQEIKRLNDQIIENGEPDQAEKERVLNKAKLALSQGYNSNSKLKGLIPKEWQQDRVNKSAYSQNVKQESQIKSFDNLNRDHVPAQNSDQNDKKNGFSDFKSL